MEKLIDPRNRFTNAMDCLENKIGRSEKDNQDLLPVSLPSSGTINLDSKAIIK